jgi:predicted GNAT family acetyltransferase
MVLVDPQNRRQGIATRLMETALDYLRGRVATVKLDATAQGKPVYERFGFEVESLVERWVGTLKGSSIIQNYGILNPDTLYELLDLDRRAFNADRSMLIQSLINDSNFLPVVKKSADGKLTGYALARPGTRANYLGPICVTQASDVESLIDEMLRRMGANRVYIDFNRECGTGTSVLSARGFVKERDLIRMTSGERGQKTSPVVVAIAGPEIG